MRQTVRGSRGAVRLAVAAAVSLWIPAAAHARQSASGSEVVVEVRIHGNYATPDADVLALAGLTVGQPVDAAVIREVEARLQRSGRFEDVEIRKRFRSMDSTTDIVLVIIVREHPMADAGPPTPLGPLRRVAGSMQFLPMLDYEDGYGFTYGGRLTFADALGRASRISVPLTWGGVKRAAVEMDRELPAGPIDRIEGGASLSSVTNPAYDLADGRKQVWFGVRRSLTGALSVGARAGYADVSFGDLDDRLGTFGADVTLDTRADPVFPRNALFAHVAWEGLNPRASAYANRARFDVRGYVGLVGQSVLSLRWQYGVSDAPVPPYERLLLGGGSTLRGWRAGSFAGDNLMAATGEVRVPLSSPLGVTRAGISFFVDVGAAYDHGTRLADTRFRVGSGAGVFLLASVFKLSLDLGFREGGGRRLHFSTGLQF
jgi:outer membrane protein assembly factor BamA